MTYLIVCNHLKQVKDAPDPNTAASQFGCKLCRQFDLKRSKMIYKNVRVYKAYQKDAEIVASQREEPPREKQIRQPKVHPIYIPL
jgi:hypothetical protein